MTAATSADDILGPVDLIVIGFPAGTPHSGGFDRLIDLVDAGTVRVLDFEFVRRDTNGVRVGEISDLPAVEGFDKDFWSGASSHLLGAEDLDALAADLRAGELALVLLIEQQWLLGLIDGWVSGGARVIAEGGVAPQDLVEAVEAAELREETV